MLYILVDGIPTPLKNMSSPVGIIPNIWKNKNHSKAPTSLFMRINQKIMDK